MNEMQNRGNSFLYNVLDLLRNSDEKINVARLIYLLSRLEPEQKNSTLAQQKIYKEFSEKIYNWSRDGEQRKYLICALMIYVYLTRNEEK